MKLALEASPYAPESILDLLTKIDDSGSGMWFVSLDGRVVVRGTVWNPKTKK